MVVFLQQGLLTGSATLIIAAFAGSMAAMAFVLVVARRVRGWSILVICGIMIGYICSAVTDIVVTFAQDSNIVNLHNWSMGSFSGMTWENVLTAALIVLPCLALSFMLSKPMAAYQMGEAMRRVSAFPCVRSQLHLCCYPACSRHASRHLRGRSPLSASRCRIS